MAKKVGNNEVFNSDNIFSSQAKGAKALKVLLDAVEDQLKAILKVSTEIVKNPVFENADDIKKVSDAIESQNKAVAGLSKVQKQKLALDQKLKALRKGQLDETIKIREEIKAETREIRNLAKENNQLLGAYTQQSARLNRLRKEYKDLAAQNKGNTKEAKALLEEITELDERLKRIDKTVGQNQRSVGDYEKALKKLNGALTKLGVVALVVKTFEGLSSAFSSNSRTGAELEKILTAIPVALSVIISRVADAIPVIKTLFSDFTNSTNRFFLEFELRLAKAPIIGDNKRAKEIQKELDGLAKSSGKSLSDLAGFFEGVGDEITKTIAKNNEFIDSTLSNRKAIAALTESQTELIKSSAQLEIQSGDNTLSLTERANATEQLIEKQSELNDIQIKIAQIELKQAKERLAIFRDDIDAREAVTDATIRLAEAEAKALQDRFNAEKELRDIESDDIERNLDFIIDIADKRKDVNDSIIANEKKTFDEREKALKANQDIEEDLLRRGSEELNKFAKEEIDLNELRNESDAKVIANKLKNAGLNDRLVGRGLELIRDNIALNKELEQSLDELNEAEKESNEIKRESEIIEAAILELQKEGIDVQEVLLKLSNDRLQAEIDNLNLRLASVEKGSEEEIRLRKELDEKLLEQAQNRADAEAKIEAENRRRIAEVRELALSGASEFARKSQDSTISAIDAEISALEAREARLNQLAAKGRQDADNNLALEQRRRAELERKRAQAIKRQQQIELGLSVLETYSNKVAADDPNALGSTIRDTSVLLAFINSLPSFSSGADRIGDVSDPIRPGVDGNLAWVDKEEMIMNPLESKMIRNSGLSRMEVASMAQMYGKGWNTPSIAVSDNSEVVKAINSLKTSVDNKPVESFNYDAVKDATISAMKSRNKIEKTIRKNWVIK